MKQCIEKGKVSFLTIRLDFSIAIKKCLGDVFSYLNGCSQGMSWNRLWDEPTVAIAISN